MQRERKTLLLDKKSQTTFSNASSTEISFNFSKRIVKRNVVSVHGKKYSTHFPFKSSDRTEPSEEARNTFDKCWLKSKTKPQNNGALERVRVVDLFSGCGGMSLGIDEACRSLGLRADHIFTAELDPIYAKVYANNFQPTLQHVGDINSVMPGEIYSPLTVNEISLKEKVGNIDILCGGPPCQGHSDLNNYTRRRDPRNVLYSRMGRAAELFKPKSIVIENVPGVQRDKTGVFLETIKLLEDIGYCVKIITLDASFYGVPQARKRTFVIALENYNSHTNFKSVLGQLLVPSPRNTLWALEDTGVGKTEFFKPSTLSDESKRRVEWLFDNNQHELPDAFRPDCHRLKNHTYKSVYGRMYADRPAPTITTGCLVMGQGRFIHPIEARTITPHEAARLQSFPDFFEFGTQKRTAYAKMVGNAVPPMLAFAVGLGILSI